jgi:predicted ATP-grasp superfamily ATP-dependent carboligase
MVDLARSIGGKPALISSSDQFTAAIARHHKELGTAYVMCPGWRLQGLLADKQTQYELAQSAGMPMPRTVVVRDVSDAESFCAEATFPCLIKPKHFREWQRFPAGHPLSYRKVSIASTSEQLLQGYELAARINPTVILQEIISGADTDKRVYLGCYDRQGKRVANAMFRELRCDPMGFGPASISEPVVDEETDEVCDRFLRRIGYIGICEIEMKRDSRDGRVKLIEANPRLSGGGDAAPYAGVDLCWIHYLDLIGIPVHPVAPQRVDFRHVVLRSDGKALPSYWRAGALSWRDLRRSYRRPLAFYDLDAGDWLYSLETLAVAGRSLVVGMLGKHKA